jgi:hypothetical protein
MKRYILKKSTRADKRFAIDMGGMMEHNFASKGAETFIDHKDEKKKKAWIARHKNDKNYNDMHSAIYHSKNLLWNKATLTEAIKDYEKRHKVTLINQTGIK